eukprot:scaffold4097_cov306-Pinguiococcus_pyrenoidosus.AAC.23
MESRDAARVALRMPVWSLGGALDNMGYEDVVARVRHSPDAVAWTPRVCRNCCQMLQVAELADYTGTEALRLMYAKLADDKREEEVQGGRLPEQVRGTGASLCEDATDAERARIIVQVALDRAAFFMDAVACGLGKDDGSWESAELRGKLAGLYREAKLESFADFVEA